MHFGSNGLTLRRSGDMYYRSDGLSYQKSGDMVFCSDGRSWRNVKSDYDFEAVVKSDML